MFLFPQLTKTNKKTLGTKHELVDKACQCCCAETCHNRILA